MTACASCGRLNPAGTQFCSGCGEYLGWQSEGEVNAPERVEQPEPERESAAQPEPERESLAQPGQQPEPVAERVSRGAPVALAGFDPAPQHDPAEEPAPGLAQAVSALEQGRRLAEQHERPDLERHLAVARARLTGQVLGIAVVGEFKRGKSTLVNALLQTDICPVDADIVTTVPTLIRYGAPPSGLAHLAPPDDARPGPSGPPDPGDDSLPDSVEQAVDVDRLFELVSEAADPSWQRRLQSVEVRLPHRLLRTGLCLIDTPGVGGLDSAHGVVTLATLNNACGMIFVTDASQELTAPEVEFLRQALERCPAAICVVTKTDLHPEWRRIAELDRQHLAEAGINIPLVAVSSFLRLRAWREPSLNQESGFAELFDWLRTDVIEVAVGEAVTAAGRDLGFAQDQLRLEVTAEQQVLTEPETSEFVVKQLRSTSERTRRLLESGTGWQQFLFDGAEDLVADVRHDLAERIRLLTAEVDSVIEQGDPKETWPDLEIWLQRQVVRAVTANYDLLRERAEQLAAAVADSFAMDSEVPLELGLTAPVDVLRGLALGAPQTSAPGGQRAARMLFTGRSATLIPTLVLSYAIHVPLLAMTLGPLSLLLGAGIGRKLMRDERQRQLLYRRQQAKIACRRYLDEAAFAFGHHCLESLRRTRRELRDEFQSRAAVMHASSQRALSSAERAVQLQPDERRARTAELARRDREIEHLTPALAAS
jgi:ethanolamine utilization protein EutP (predicted NTPase)